jgi:integrase
MVKKHKVKEDVREFCGYDFLIKLTETLGHPLYKALVALLFETGGRISEVLNLRKSNFVKQKNYLEIREIPVLKRYRKIEKISDTSKKSGFHWITEKRREFRSIPIPLSSPLIFYIIEYIQKLKDDEKLFPITRQTAFNKIRQAGKVLDKNLELYPHWFRAQKASQLASEYGFDVFGLQEFFKWVDSDMARHYASLGAKGLARRMGLE